MNNIPKFVVLTAWKRLNGTIQSWSMQIPHLIFGQHTTIATERLMRHSTFQIDTKGFGAREGQGKL
jgi:hypothetical protein